MTKKTYKELEELIKKYESNWFYCQSKNEYGNEIRFFIEDVVEDLKTLREALTQADQRGS